MTDLIRRKYLEASWLLLFVISWRIRVCAFATGRQDSDRSDHCWQQSGLGNSSEYNLQRIQGKQATSLWTCS